jgi:hypothetical protein
MVVHDLQQGWLMRIFASYCPQQCTGNWANEFGYSGAKGLGNIQPIRPPHEQAEAYSTFWSPEDLLQHPLKPTLLFGALKTFCSIC